MKYPYYFCTKCQTKIKEMSFPISRNEQYPDCPECGTNKQVDIALGDENTKIDTKTIIYKN